MTFDEEKFIAAQFAKLPRKSLELTGKEKVWLKIQNYLRQARAEKMVIRNSPVGFWKVFRFRKLAFSTLVILVALGLVTGATRASQDSLPGETLYSVKKAAERVEQVLATSDKAKVTVGIKHARRRLEEVKILVQENKKEAVVAKTLAELKTTTDQVVSVASAAEPELKSKATDLVTEEALVLTTVKEQAQEDIKPMVQEVLSASHESISILKGEIQDQVEGALSEMMQATTTASTTEQVKSKKPKVQDSIIESPIQIHDIIEVESLLPENESQSEEPEILPEPRIGP